MLLDANAPIKSNVSLISSILAYGLLGCLVLISLNLFTHIARVEGFQLPTIIYKVIKTGVWIGVIVMAVSYCRDQKLGGFISYSRATVIGILITLMMTVFITAWVFVFFSYIEPQLLGMVNAEVIQMQERMTVSQVQSAEFAKTLMPSILTLDTLKMSLKVGLVVSLTTALIMKKEPEIA